MRRFKSADLSGQSVYRSLRQSNPRPFLPWLDSDTSLSPFAAPIASTINLSSSRCPLWQQQSRGRAAVPVEDPNGAMDAQRMKSQSQRRSAKKQDSMVGKGKGKQKEAPDPAPRNPVGVQLLSPSLHSQLFPPSATTSPSPDPLSLSLSLSHLSTHSLSPSQASVLDPIEFTLPPLKGDDLSKHFWTLGREIAQPWLGMAHELAKVKIVDHPEGTEDATPMHREENHSQNGDEESLDVEVDGIDQKEWISLPRNLREEVHPRTSKWRLKPGWTRYPILRASDPTSNPISASSPPSSTAPLDQNLSSTFPLDSLLGEGYPVDHPLHEDGALSFDVETMPKTSPYPVMATAVCENAWYSWLSPWLLNEGQGREKMDHLIPFGSNPHLDLKSRSSSSRQDRDQDQQEEQTEIPARLLIGHNVSFDRARILDEYSLTRSNIRFLDTMSLHVATRGISSPQRPAWVNHSKARALKKAEKILKMEEIREETKRALRIVLGMEDASGENPDETDIHSDLLRELDLDLNALGVINQESLQEPGIASKSITNSEGELDHENASTLWQDVTSSNSLADVASLHCGISMSKEDRNLFVEATDRSTILENLPSLLTYCARDSSITLQVFQKVFPAFIQSCPNPATLAGVLALGSAILPIDQEWEQYRQKSEKKYEDARTDVSKSLVELAEALKEKGTKGKTWGYLTWCKEQRGKKLEFLRSEMEEKEIEKPKAKSKGKAKKETEKSGEPDSVGGVTSDSFENSSNPKESRDKQALTGDEELDYQAPWWEEDLWASQLDWTPKRPKKLKIAISDLSEDGSNPDHSTSPQVQTQLLPLLPGYRRVPKWYREALKGKNGLSARNSAIAIVMKLQYDGKAVVRDEDGTWTARSGNLNANEIWEEPVDLGGSPLRKAFLKSETKKSKGSPSIASSEHSPSKAQAVIEAIISGTEEVQIRALLTECAEEVVRDWEENGYVKSVEDGLDWKVVEIKDERSSQDSTTINDVGSSTGLSARQEAEPEWWPKWYWDLFDPKTGMLDLTIRTRISPILLKISWRGHPLFHSREHGWIYRELQTTSDDGGSDRSKARDFKPLTFKNPADVSLHLDTLISLPAPSYFKVPHPSGDKSNVGSPFSKSFLGLFENQVLQSQQDDKGKEAARNALEMNAQCSYWIGVRDRVAQQMVVWNGEAGTKMGFEKKGQSGFSSPSESRREKSITAGMSDDHDKKGLILPQVVSMGTVTRRAIEKTWLTASNAKKNRVGSELKAMVKAPSGWNIVGADVDSEELWICSVMGDAQFGFHGATAVGWMTLEGTKSLGTDLHSKTASILGTSRNQAKVFNYSRIYGAGINHAKQLLMKADPNMNEDEAKNRAKDLYSKTKGMNSPLSEAFGNRRFWYGGTESYVFNKLEEIAISNQPKTPALDCGVTAALSRTYLPKKTWDDGRRSEDYMPSRINWVVQSSGVDYLHLLMTSMEHLCKTYDIHARFMLSVHDEVRYLCKEEDTDRTALALQISNLWTRAMFSHKLQIDNLPQGCAFFALVDTDKVLRKEVDDPCVTPSHPDPIPPGLALTIEQTLKNTNNGSLHRDGRPMKTPELSPELDEFSQNHNQAISPASPFFPPYVESDQKHRSIGKKGLYYLQAQAANDSHEIRALERRVREIEAQTPFESAVKGREFGKKRGPSLAGSRRMNLPRKESLFSQSALFSTQSRSLCNLVSSVGISATQNRLSSTSARSDAVNQSASMASTSDPVPAPLSPTVDDLPSSRDLLLAQFPAKPDYVRRTVHRFPFFTKPDHRIQIRWGLYRNLMRSCNALMRRGQESAVDVQRQFHQISLLKSWIRTKFLVNSKVSQKSILLGRISQGNDLLGVMNKILSSGDKESQDSLSLLISNITDKRYKRRWDNSINKSIESETPVRVPRPSGALLPATYYNPPLPRFKPIQPESISMTIFKRRLNRAKRATRQAELSESKRDLIREAQFEQTLMRENTRSGKAKELVASPSFADDVHSWLQPANEQLDLIRQCFERDEARSKMTFDVRTLLEAKAARRQRHRRRLAQKIQKQGGLIDESQVDQVRPRSQHQHQRGHSATEAQSSRKTRAI